MLLFDILSRIVSRIFDALYPYNPFQSPTIQVKFTRLCMILLAPRLPAHSARATATMPQAAGPGHRAGPHRPPSPGRHAAGRPPSRRSGARLAGHRERHPAPDTQRRTAGETQTQSAGETIRRVIRETKGRLCDAERAKGKETSAKRGL